MRMGHASSLISKSGDLHESLPMAVAGVDPQNRLKNGVVTKE